MKQLFRSIFLIFLLNFVAHSTDPALSVLPKLDSFIQHAMKKKQVPGMAVAIVSKGQIIYMKGFGVRALGEQKPVTHETLFQIGSVSKAITSTLIAILHREKVLNLDDPILLLPGVKLRHVLSHTTGVPSIGFNTLLENGISPLEIQKKIQMTPLTGLPGSIFSYHNVVYNLSQEVIEQSTGMSFEQTLLEKLFRPLKMKKTFSTWQSFIADNNRTFPHIFKTQKNKKNRVEKIIYKTSYRKEYTNFPAAGGISSNIQDMAQFLAAVMGARPDIISSQDLSEFINPIIHTPDQWQRSSADRDRITKTQYALGWRHLMFANHPLLFHGSWVRGFCCMLAFLPNQDVGIVILQNTESNLSFRLAMQFFDWVLGLPPKKWI